MGTRGLTIVRKDGKNVIAQYGQWDHSPEGQGTTILNFISNPDNLNRLESNLSLCRFIDDNEMEKLMEGYETNNGFWTFEEADRFASVHPQLSRDMGGQILEFVANATNEVMLRDDADFAKDTLFCEGVYRIDFDTREFWVQYGTITIFDLDNLPDHETFIKTLYAAIDEQPMFL